MRNYKAEKNRKEASRAKKRRQKEQRKQERRYSEDGNEISDEDFQALAASDELYDARFDDRKDPASEDTRGRGREADAPPERAPGGGGPPRGSGGYRGGGPSSGGPGGGGGGYRGGGGPPRGGGDRRPRRPRAPDGARLFVGGLSWDTNDDSLRQAFSQFGNVTEAVIINDRETGRSRGFGFVTFETKEEAENATKGMDGADLDGRRLRVNEAQPRPPRPPR